MILYGSRHQPESDQCKHELNAVAPDDWSPPDPVRVDGEDPADEDENESAPRPPQSGQVVVAVNDQESCQGCDYSQIQSCAGKL